MDIKKNEIVNNAVDIINNLRAKHNIKAAYIFGSYSKGNFSENSDIDIAVIVRKIKGNYLWFSARKR